MKRIVSSGALAVAIALLAVGCGGKGSSSTRSTGSAASSQAVAAYARAINIQPADVPALSAEGREARLYQSVRIVLPFHCGRIKFASGEPSERERLDKRFHIHKPRFATDYLGFADGRAEVTLLVFRTTDAAPLALERRLLALLCVRARAHTP